MKKKCLMCGEIINKQWGHKDLHDHEASHSPKRFLGYVIIE